jgi:hypothetical protein
MADRDRKQPAVLPKQPESLELRVRDNDAVWVRKRRQQLKLINFPLHKVGTSIISSSSAKQSNNNHKIIAEDHYNCL